MKVLEVKESRDFGLFLKRFFEGLLRELVLLVRKGLSLGVMLFLALTTLSALNWGTSYLEGSVKNLAVEKRSESFVPDPPRNLVIPRQMAARVPAAYTFQPAVTVQSSSSKSARNTLRESGYLVNEINSFARSLARLGR